jgi:hypothetical protein
VCVTRYPAITTCALPDQLVKVSPWSFRKCLSHPDEKPPTETTGLSSLRDRSAVDWCTRRRLFGHVAAIRLLVSDLAEITCRPAKKTAARWVLIWPWCSLILQLGSLPYGAVIPAPNHGLTSIYGKLESWGSKYP